MLGLEGRASAMAAPRVARHCIIILTLLDGMDCCCRYSRGVVCYMARAVQRQSRFHILPSRYLRTRGAFVALRRAAETLEPGGWDEGAIILVPKKI